MGDESFNNIFENAIFKFISRLGGIERVASLFNPKNGFSKNFERIWRINDLHRIIKLPSYDSKDVIEANLARNLGNSIFMSKYYEDARKLYTIVINDSPFNARTMDDCKTLHERSLCYPATEVDAQYSCHGLSLGFANRSAALFHLNYFEECLLDICRALFFGYPKEKKAKLIERQAKCYMYMKQKREAIECIDKYLADNRKIAKTAKQDLIALKTKFENDQNLKKTVVQVRRCVIPTAPTLIRTNPFVPVLSDAVEVKPVPKKGRGLVATRHIMPGEISANEEDFCNNFPSEDFNYCISCVQRSVNPFPCPFCTEIVFCNEKCWIEGLKKYHFLECKSYSVAAKFKFPWIIPSFLVRFLFHFSLRQLKEATKKAEALKKPPLFNEKYPYKKGDYTVFYHQDTRLEHLKPKDMFEACFVTACLVKILQQNAKEYLNDFGDPKEVLKFLGPFLVRHYSGFKINGFYYDDIQSFYNDTSDCPKPALAFSQRNKKTGMYATGLISLTNHSCLSNSTIFSYGNKRVIESVLYIPKGHEVTIDYLPNTADDRSKQLFELFKFKCACIPCAESWPLMFKSEDKIYFQCSNCSKNILLNSKKCSHCKRRT